MNDNAKKWVAALRSGEFEQGTHALHIVDDGYCCLGVACELYRRENPEALSTEVIERRIGLDKKETKIVAYDGLFGSMPPIVREWLGLRTPGGDYSEGNSLANDNDHGDSFEQIANTIESEPEGLFGNA